MHPLACDLSWNGVERRRWVCCGAIALLHIASGVQRRPCGVNPCAIPPTHLPSPAGPRKWKRQSPALQKAAARLDATRLERSTTDRDKLLRFIGLCDHLVLAQLCSLARSALALCLSELTQPRKVGLFLMVGYVDESAAAAAAARSAVATASSVSAAQQHSAWTRQTGARTVGVWG